MLMLVLVALFIVLSIDGIATAFLHFIMKFISFYCSPFSSLENIKSYSPRMWIHVHISIYLFYQ